jgi:hypothetical protein
MIELINCFIKEGLPAETGTPPKWKVLSLIISINDYRHGDR